MELLPPGQIKSKWRVSALVVVSLIIGFILGWFTRQELINQAPKLDWSALGVKTTTTASTTVSFKIEDQPPGNQVLIRDVKIVDNLWLAVYEDREGEPGNVLGAVFVRSGEYPALAIPLLRNTVDDLPYYVQAHSDNGDGMFDHRVDPLVKEFSLTAGTFTTKTTGSRGDN